MPFSHSLSKLFFRIAQRDDRSGFPRLSATPVFKTRQQRFLKFFANFGPRFSENKTDGDFTARSLRPPDDCA
jgi:hypothetical protein